MLQDALASKSRVFRGRGWVDRYFFPCPTRLSACSSSLVRSFKGNYAPREVNSAQLTCDVENRPVESQRWRSFTPGHWGVFHDRPFPVALVGAFPGVRFASPGLFSPAPSGSDCGSCRVQGLFSPAPSGSHCGSRRIQALKGTSPAVLPVSDSLAPDGLAPTLVTGMAVERLPR
jgi:hypothetical protein